MSKRLMKNNLRENKYKKVYFIFMCIFICICTVYINNHLVYAYTNNIKTVKGYKIKNDEIVVKNSKGLYEVNMSNGKFPSKISWNWQGSGETWACVKYSDKNVIYYLMGDSEIPKTENITFIDSNGIPKVIVPKIFRVKRGKVNFDLINAYYKYYGDSLVDVESITFHVDTKKDVTIKDFKFLDYKDKANDEESLLDGKENKLHLGVHIPQGNNKDFYLIKNKTSPLEISLRAFLDKAANGYLKVTFPENINITSCSNDKVKFIDKNTLKLSIDEEKGYLEKKVIIMANIKESGAFNVEVNLGDEVKKISKNINVIDLNQIKDKVNILEQGVYPVEEGKEDAALKKQLKNNIKIKQNVSDILHRFIGNDEDYDNPAGVVSGIFKNSSKMDIPVNVKFSVLDDKGKEIKYFRGEHFQKEEEFKAVPETNMVIKSKDSINLKMPIYADAYSVKPGKYRGKIQVSFFGTDCNLISEEFDLYVHRESQFQKIIIVIASLLSIACLVLLYKKQKKWTKNLKTSQVMLIALFTTVKFALVDVAWFVMSDVIRALLGPLGPAMHLVTGIFWDVINSLFLVTLVSLVCRPGVIIISTIVRLILKAIAFGSFNPVAILLMMSYAVIAEGLLYITGFTSGKRKFETNLKVFIIIGIIFGIQNCYSTYSFYYIWMYLYRLFYPSWYININAIFSVVYSIIGSISGIYLGKKLKKVID